MNRAYLSGPESERAERIPICCLDRRMLGMDGEGVFLLIEAL